MSDNAGLPGAPTELLPSGLTVEVPAPKRKRGARKADTNALRHGLYSLSDKLRERINGRWALGAPIADARGDLGGIETLTAQQLQIVDPAVRTKALVDSVDLWLLTRPSIVGGQAEDHRASNQGRAVARSGRAQASQGRRANQGRKDDFRGRPLRALPFPWWPATASAPIEDDRRKLGGSDGDNERSRQGTTPLAVYGDNCDGTDLQNFAYELAGLFRRNSCLHPHLPVRHERMSCRLCGLPSKEGHL